MKILKSKLYQQELDKQHKQAQENVSTMKAIEWGAQIRSYYIHPNQLVKDHQTNLEKTNAEDVLNGNIQDFIDCASRMSIGENS